MPRLIDAEELELQFDVSDEDIIAKEIIRNAPTVDAVPVVRCKDCVEFEQKVSIQPECLNIRTRCHMGIAIIGTTRRACSQIR